MADTAENFTATQWKSIFEELNVRGTDYGLPAQRVDSLVLASWNLRQFGNLNRRRKPREREAFRFIASVLMHFDLVAIQEIKDDLDSVRLLHRFLPDYDLVVSDATGNNERLGFLSRSERVRRTNLAAEIDIPMTAMRKTVEDNWQMFRDEIQSYGTEVSAGREARIRFPAFLGFDRAPFSISFEAGPHDDPFRFLGFNTHIYYGKSHEDRTDEFVELLNWLFNRWGASTKIFSPNFIVFGDMNTELVGKHEDTLPKLQAHIQKQTKRSRSAALRRAREEKNAGLRNSIKQQQVLTPFLSGYDGKPPPSIGSNLAGTERYDQIFMLIRSTRKPKIKACEVFDLSSLVAKALRGSGLGVKARNARIRQQISDHLPIWIRLKLPDPL